MKLVLASSLLSVVCFPEDAAAFTASRPKIAAVRSSSYAPQTSVALQAVTNANNDNERNSQQLNRRDALFRFASATAAALVSGSQIAVAADEEAIADPATAAVAEPLLLSDSNSVIDASIPSPSFDDTVTAGVFAPAKTSSTVVAAIDPKVSVPVVAGLDAPGKQAATIDSNIILGAVGIGAGLLVVAGQDDKMIQLPTGKAPPGAGYLNSLKPTTSQKKKKSTGAAISGYLDTLGGGSSSGESKSFSPRRYNPRAAKPAPVAAKPAPVAAKPAPAAVKPAPVAATPAPVAATPAPVEAATPATEVQEPVTAPVVPPPAPVAPPMPPMPAPVVSSTPAAAAMFNPMLAGKAASAPKKGYGFGSGNWKNSAPPAAFPVAPPQAPVVPAPMSAPPAPVVSSTPASAAMFNPMMAGKAASAPKKGYGFGSGSWKNAAPSVAAPVVAPSAEVHEWHDPVPAPPAPVMPSTPASAAMSNPMLAGKAASAPKKGYGFGSGNWKQN